MLHAYHAVGSSLRTFASLVPSRRRLCFPKKKTTPSAQSPGNSRTTHDLGLSARLSSSLLTAAGSCSSLGKHHHSRQDSSQCGHPSLQFSASDLKSTPAVLLYSTTAIPGLDHNVLLLVQFRIICRISSFRLWPQ